MNRIKLLREENNITQEELAIKLNLSSKGIVSMYEKEDRKPSLEVLVKLSEIFNCSIDYILGKSDIRNLEKKTEQNILDLAQIGFSKDNYNPPTDAQKEQIKGLLEVILKDNKKDKSDK